MTALCHSRKATIVSLRSSNANLHLCIIGSALVLAALVASPSVCGLRLQTPTGVYPGAVVDETWVSEPSDPATFSLWIVNPDVHIGLALVASVNTSEGHVYFTIPDLPPSLDYFLQAVNVTDNNSVYATTALFFIA